MTRNPRPDAPPWRVAVLLDGPRVAAWVAATIDTLRSSTSVELIGWSAVELAGSARSSRAWRAYVRLDEWAFGGRATSLRTGPVDPGVTRLTTSRRVDDVRAALCAAGLDVVIDLRTHDRPVVRSVARAGTLVIRDGSEGVPAGPLSYLADMAAGAPAAPTVLVARPSCDSQRGC